MQKNEFVKRRIEKGRLIREEGRCLVNGLTSAEIEVSYSLSQMIPTLSCQKPRHEGGLMKMESVPVIDTEELMKMARSRAKV